MPEYIYSVRNLVKKYGTKEILRGVTLAFYYGAKIGVIGHNGSGKSTLLRIMGGADTDFDGDAMLLEGSTVGYVAQEPSLDPKRTVIENIEDAVAPVRALLKRYEMLSEKLGESMSDAEMAKVVDQHEHTQREIELRDAWELDHHLELAMHALRCPPPNADVSKISGGERRRVALCRALIAHPDLLLLDEPTNHLDAETVSWLEHHLAEYPGTVILVTHDRYFLDNVAKWMLEMDRGRATPYEGNYSAYLEKKQQRLIVEEKSELTKQKVLARELEWIRQSPRARIAKNKARIANYERMAAEQNEARDEAIELTIPAGKPLGARVVDFKNVSKSLGDKTLIQNLSLSLPPGAILGVIGPNGAGKTTFLKLITGELKPDKGTVDIGASVELCYVDQGRETLDGDRTVFQEITGGQDQLTLGKRTVNSRAYVSWFNFKGTDQQQKVGEISGGQRNRVQLAKLLRRGGNLLLLDEPTNDLDLQTLRVLEEALQNYAGSAIVVTHDRYFLNRISTHVLAFDGEGNIRFFEGDFSTFEERLDRERQEAGKGPESSAGKYRKFSR